MDNREYAVRHLYAIQPTHFCLQLSNFWRLPYSAPAFSKFGHPRCRSCSHSNSRTERNFHFEISALYDIRLLLLFTSFFLLLSVRMQHFIKIVRLILWTRKSTRLTQFYGASCVVFVCFDYNFIHDALSSVGWVSVWASPGNIRTHHCAHSCSPYYSFTWIASPWGKNILKLYSWCIVRINKNITVRIISGL
jgi:hypothetical protein